MSDLDLRSAEPPAGLTPALRALWWDAKDQWEAAHQAVAAESGRDAAWVHGYLHRKEGDIGNASYWYRRAGRPNGSGSLDQEWQFIVDALSAKS